jgi:hypothetical protein
MTDPSGRPWGEPDGPPQPYYPGSTPPPSGHRNGLGTGSLVLALVALATTVTLVGGVVLGITAAVMGFVARGRVKRGEATNGGVAMAGILLGILAAVVELGLIWLAFGTDLFNEDYQHCLGEANGHAEYCQQYR